MPPVVTLEYCMYRELNDRWLLFSDAAAMIGNMDVMSAMVWREGIVLMIDGVRRADCDNQKFTL